MKFNSLKLDLNTTRTFFGRKPRPASALLMRSMMQYLRRCILNIGPSRIMCLRWRPGLLSACLRLSRFAGVDHLERPKDWREIDHVVCGRSQYVPKICGD